LRKTDLIVVRVDRLEALQLAALANQLQATRSEVLRAALHAYAAQRGLNQPGFAIALELAKREAQLESGT